MYADNTLTPKEATRLCALGMLAKEPLAYGELAAGVRHFVTHVMGPSLDVLGTSIELLKHEGLVVASDDTSDGGVLRITEEGKHELNVLLLANLKSAENDLNKLVIALKLRFLDLLDEHQKIEQLDLLSHAFENELARLENLRSHHADEGGFLVAWLDREIEDLERRLAWLSEIRASID